MGGLHADCHLAREPGEAQRARQHVAQVCQGLDADVVATAQLLTSELFANALDHSEGPITLSVIRNSVLRVEMTDDSARSPVVRAIDVEDEHGRGMLIVDTLAKAWGARRAPGGRGKLVWFCLDMAT